MSVTPDVESLLRDLATAVERDHRRGGRRRRLLGGLAAAAVVCTAGVALAGSYADWWTGAEPPVNPRQVDRVIEENTIGLLTPDGSRKATVARTPSAALVAVATKGGGYCLIPSLTGRPSIGNSCTSAPESELRTYASPPGTTGTRVWILYGRVIDDGAASLDLRGVGLAEPVPLARGGFFLLELPQTRWAALDNRHGRASVLDVGGRVLRTGCAWLGPAPGSYGSGNRWGMLGDDPDSCEQTVPPPVVIDTEHAFKLVETTLTHRQGIYRPGDRIAMWRASTTRGDTCFFIGLADVRPTPSDGANPAGAGTCGSATWASQGPIQVSAGESLAGDRYTVLVTGRVEPGSGIARVELESASGRVVQTAFGNDAFIAELPGAPRAGKRPGPVPGGPYTAVGYDTHGNKVASTPVPGSS
jgi:hypothetical protein